MSFKKQIMVDEELDRMERLGIIHELTNPSSSCLVAVPKKGQGGGVRIVADMRHLNSLAPHPPVYPLPHCDDLLGQAGRLKP